jgi:nucleoid-associated protein YgaU
MRTFWRAVLRSAALSAAAYVLMGLGRATLSSARHPATPDVLVTSGAELLGVALLAWLALRLLLRRSALPLLAAAALLPVSALAATTPGPATSWPSLDRAPVVTHHAPAPRRYVVRPGDTLWGIAARHLSGRPSAHDIARAWPAWWTTNRAVVGDDPNVIHPGQRLAAPVRQHP